MIKLIACDLDGTLIPEGTYTLNPDIYDIILDLKKHGISFVSASGRQLDSQHNLYGPIADDISYIAENGSLVEHGGQTSVTTEISRELTSRIFEESKKRPACKFLISCPSSCYVPSGDNAFFRHMKDFVGNTTTTFDTLADIKEPILKIAIWDLKDGESSFLHFKELFKDVLKIVTSGNSWIDFLPHYSNKATALKIILDQMQILPSEVMSFGDQLNDIEMLDFTGISYAMSHATDEVKRHATDTTCSVIQTLQEFIKTLG